MAGRMTNFAYLCELLGVAPKELSAAIGRMRLRITFWTRINGWTRPCSRRCWPPIIRRSRLKPARKGARRLRTGSPAPGKGRLNSKRGRALDFLLRKNALTEPEYRAVYGLEGVQGGAITYLDLMSNLKEKKEMLFVCSDGLEMLTRDDAFGNLLIDKLLSLCEAGHRFIVVVRTDYRVSDISAFAGRWLAAHLLGYIKSYYYDDFGKPYTEKMLIAVKGYLAGRVTGKPGDPSGAYTTMHFDEPTVDAIYRQCEEYKRKAKQRFHYDFFKRPEGFLRGIGDYYDQPSYLFTRLPHFGVTPAALVQERYTLTGDEAAHVLSEFAPLFADPSTFSAGAPVRHVFCENDIEEALLKTRSVSWELTAMCGRRVFMMSRQLAQQLSRIQALLRTHQNYEVCFLPKDVFVKLTMQIGVWGNSAAIGWVTQGESTACKDFTNVGALHGFCAMAWDRIPGMMKGRNAANRKLGIWLKKAKKYGYSVR